MCILCRLCGAPVPTSIYLWPTPDGGGGGGGVRLGEEAPNFGGSPSKPPCCTRSSDPGPAAPHPKPQTARARAPYE